MTIYSDKDNQGYERFKIWFMFVWGVFVGLVVMHYCVPNIQYVNYPVGADEVKKCADDSGQFSAYNIGTELMAQCIYPSRTVNY